MGPCKNNCCQFDEQNDDRSGRENYPQPGGQERRVCPPSAGNDCAYFLHPNHNNHIHQLDTRPFLNRAIFAEPTVQPNMTMVIMWRSIWRHRAVMWLLATGFGPRQHFSTTKVRLFNTNMPPIFIFIKWSWRHGVAQIHNLAKDEMTPRRSLAISLRVQRLLGYSLSALPAQVTRTQELNFCAEKSSSADEIGFWTWPNPGELNRILMDLDLVFDQLIVLLNNA